MRKPRHLLTERLNVLFTDVHVKSHGEYMLTFMRLYVDMCFFSVMHVEACFTIQKYMSCHHTECGSLLAHRHMFDSNLLSHTVT